MKLVWKRGWRLGSVKWRYVGIVGGSSFWGWFSSRFWLRFNDLVFWDWADVYLDDDAGDVLFCFFCLFLPGTATIIILIAMHFLYFPAKKKAVMSTTFFWCYLFFTFGEVLKGFLAKWLKTFPFVCCCFLPHPTFVIYPTWQFEDVEVENNKSKCASAKSGSAE